VFVFFSIRSTYPAHLIILHCTVQIIPRDGCNITVPTGTCNRTIRRSNHREGKNVCFTAANTNLGPIQTPYTVQWMPGRLPRGVKCQGGGVDHSHHLAPRLKEE
jgi:hypothetical protein